MPLEPDDRIVAYFIGLKNPTLLAPNNQPLYKNYLLFGTTGITLLDQGAILNTYALYRVEFDPKDPNFANWNLATNRGQPNPNFFYDTATASGAGGNGLPFTANWKNATISVMNAETSDVARWLEDTPGKAVPHSLFSVAPAATDEEVAQPNRSPGQYALASGVTSPPPSRPSNTTWTTATGSARRTTERRRSPRACSPLPRPTAASSSGRGSGSSTPQTGTFVFDTQQSAPRNRLVAYNSVTGRVVLGFLRADPKANKPLSDQGALRAEAPAERGRLLRRSQGRHGGPIRATANAPTSLGAALGAFRLTDSDRARHRSGAARDPARGRGDAERHGAAPARGVDRSKWTAWTAMSPETWPPTGSSIAYDTGRRRPFQPRRGRDNLGRHRGRRSRQPRGLLVKYSFQPTSPATSCGFQYMTKELSSVRLGVVQFTRRAAELIPFEVTERVQPRNLKK